MWFNGYCKWCSSVEIVYVFIWGDLFYEWLVNISKVLVYKCFGVEEMYYLLWVNLM